jgi:uncharacterized membrane protein YhdT
MSRAELIILCVFAVMGAYLPAIFAFPLWAAFACYAFTLIVIVKAARRAGTVRRHNHERKS